jgi:hypothetical protein
MIRHPDIEFACLVQVESLAISSPKHIDMLISLMPAAAKTEPIAGFFGVIAF